MRLVPIIHGKDGPLILRRIRDWRAQEIETTLRVAFAGADISIPLHVLATYLAGAQLALVHWWMEQRHSDIPENLAQTVNRLQRATIRDVFRLNGDE